MRQVLTVEVPAHDSVGHDGAAVRGFRLCPGDRDGSAFHFTSSQFFWGGRCVITAVRVLLITPHLPPCLLLVLPVHWQTQIYILLPSVSNVEELEELHAFSSLCAHARERIHTQAHRHAHTHFHARTHTHTHTPRYNRQHRQSFSDYISYNWIVRRNLEETKSSASTHLLAVNLIALQSITSATLEEHPGIN